MTELHGKTALVTGASRDIGQAVALRLGQLGANVVVNSSRDEIGASQTVNTIDEAGSAAVDVKADVSKPTEIEALFQTAQERFGGIDIVIANAGIDETDGNMLEVTEADYNRMFDVNAKGAFFTLQYAGRAVRDGGSIVYVDRWTWGSTDGPVEHVKTVCPQGHWSTPTLDSLATRIVSVPATSAAHLEVASATA